MQDVFSLIGLSMLLLAMCFLIYFCLFSIPLWITALASGVKLSIFSILGMRLRKAPLSLIVNHMILAQNAGISLNSNELESHHLSGGKIADTVNALIAAKAAEAELSFIEAVAVDLSGGDVLEYVQTLKQAKT